jgi:ABC-type glutathione transport system ATPase component
MEPVLSVHDLTKTFSRLGQTELTAVNHISFDLMPGECLGIIGESGSGKNNGKPHHAASGRNRRNHPSGR